MALPLRNLKSAGTAVYFVNWRNNHEDSCIERQPKGEKFYHGPHRFVFTVIVLGLVPQNGLAASAAHIELPFKLQCVLQGVWFAGIQRDSRRERKVPGFDGGIAVVDADVHVAQLLMF